jgi:hypothetical protein
LKLVQRFVFEKADLSLHEYSLISQHYVKLPAFDRAIVAQWHDVLVYLSAMFAGVDLSQLPDCQRSHVSQGSLQMVVARGVSVFPLRRKTVLAPL